MMNIEDMEFKYGLESDADYEDEEEVVNKKAAVEVSSWFNESDDTIIEGVVLSNNDWGPYGPKNTYSSFIFDDNCPICSRTLTGAGGHRICCLPCGHVYGMSCIKKWLQHNQSSRRCPQCNTSCTLEDITLLRATRLPKAYATHFPFSKQGFKTFKRHALRRWDGALGRRCDALRWRVDAEDLLADLRSPYWTNRRSPLWTTKKPVYIEGVVGTPLQILHLENRIVKLAEQAIALKRQADACKASIVFFEQKYNEHMAAARQDTKH